MKKVVVSLIVVATVMLGSLAVFANGPWPNPGTGLEMNSVVVESGESN